jgi:regulator of protease activity HflC (stomatin/prohibitin superfamily)
LGQHELDELLTERDVINAKLSAIIDRQTEGWGVKVISVEVKDVEIPESMKRAMAKQAEAERESDEQRSWQQKANIKPPKSWLKPLESLAQCQVPCN